ncbi:MAG: response regulator, partial [Pedobacter sp.]
MNSTNRIKLSVMMFLEFFIWGSWFVTLGTFLGKSLGASGTQISLAYLSQSIGAIVAPFIIGLIADKFFSAQKILGTLHLIGAAVLWTASTSINVDSFIPAVIIYMILFMPTLALVNSVSFRQMKDPGKEFPAIRVLGTIGWIVAGLLIGWLNWEQSGQLSLTFKMAAGASLVLGLLSFSLPATPPLKKGEKTSLGDVLGLDAIKLLKNCQAKDELPCLVIMDINMPGMDGRQAIIKIRETPDLDQVPVAVFTTSSQASDKAFF